MSASAHTGARIAQPQRFHQRLCAPCSAWNHLAAMVAVGLWSSAARSAGATCYGAPWALRPCCWWAPCWACRGVALPAVELMIAASLLVTGLLVVSYACACPGWWRRRAVGVFAVFHGVAHGYELAGDDSAWWTLAGMLTATVLLHSAGLAAGWALRHRHVWLAALPVQVAAFGGALLAQNGLSLPRSLHDPWRTLFTEPGEHLLNAGRRTSRWWCATPATGPSRSARTTTLPKRTTPGFDRAAARGMRLNIVSGTAVRFGARPGAHGRAGGLRGRAQGVWLSGPDAGAL